MQATEELEVLQAEEFMQNMCSAERPFAVICASPPLDFSAMQPSKV